MGICIDADKCGTVSTSPFAATVANKMLGSWGATDELYTLGHL